MDGAGLRTACSGCLAFLLLGQLAASVPATLSSDTADLVAASVPATDTAVLLQTKSKTEKKLFAGNTADAGADDRPPLELVVASHCENTEWFKDFAGPIAVYAKLPECVPELRKSLGDKGRLIELPNRGREQHSYVRHILDNWDNLAEYTVFAQGSGAHNGVRVLDAARDFLARGLDKNHVNVVPIVPHNDKGFILYRDMDQNETRHGGLDPETNLNVFPKEADYADRARAMFLSLFGGSACDAPPMVFSAGAQLIARREAIRAKPRWFWEFLEKSMDGDCEGAYGYDLERMWLHLLNPKLQPREDPYLPRMCFGGGHLPENFVAWKCDNGYKEQVGTTFLQRGEKDPADSI